MPNSRLAVTAGQPEVRQYRARYYDTAGLIGTWTEIISTMTQP